MPSKPITKAMQAKLHQTLSEALDLSLDTIIALAACTSATTLWELLQLDFSTVASLQPEQRREIIDALIAVGFEPHTSYYVE